jgi:ATP-dependent exoDNAse (exonuclease V) beta subunit
MAAPGEIEAGAPEAMVARRYGFGNAVHRLLEWSARRGWAAPDRERCARALSGEHLPASDQGVERAARMIAAWLDSPLCRSTGQEGGRIRPETSFILPADGALIRGSIDLLVAPESGPPLIIDYKTDALGGEDPASHMDRYQVQRAIYALAVARASGAQTVRTAYVFLERAADAVEEEFGPERLADAATRIDELLAGIDAERFEVTPTPHAALCAGCPARERLCSHPWELTGRALPA